ncbi:centromere protein F [Ctenodactylus gundi]
MSWALEEWKEGLPSRALQKIQELEAQLDRLRKEKQQRQFQLDTLEAALQKQKQKVETEKTEGTTLKRENQRLMEICDSLEKSRQKLSHELQVKETQVNFQEGQLVAGRRHAEKLEQELKRCKSELERSQHAALSADVSPSTCSTPKQIFATPLTPSHHYSGSKYEDLKEKYDKEVEERKRLEAEVKALQAKKSSQAVPPATMNHRDIARHQASSSVFSWQQDRTPTQHSSAPQKTPLRDFPASHIFGEEEVTPSRSALLTGRQAANSSGCDSSNGAHLVEQLKGQNQELRSKVKELELRLQGHEKELKGQANRCQELQLQLEKTKVELMEKDKVLNKNEDELMRTAAQCDQAASKCAALEQKLKKLTEDLSCQRQNAESTRCSLEQRIKEREKELQEDLSRQQRAFHTLDQECTQVKARLTQELQQAKSKLGVAQADLDRVTSVKQQLEKKLEEFTQKTSRMEQASQAREMEEAALRRSEAELKKENSALRSQAEQRAREAGRLEEELREARTGLSQSRSAAEELRAKNMYQEAMLTELQEKINQQENSLMLEKLKVALADLEKQRDCSQDLLKKREHHIEQLNGKLRQVEKEAEALLRALESQRKERESLQEEKAQFSHWRSESEKLRSQLESEKESLQSQVQRLEECLSSQRADSHEACQRARVLEMDRDTLSVEIGHLHRLADSRAAEVDTHRRACEELRQRAEASERKHQKEVENLSLQTSRLTAQVQDLEHRLQFLSNEAVQKDQQYRDLQAEYETLRGLLRSDSSQVTCGTPPRSCVAFEQQPARNDSPARVTGGPGSRPSEESSGLPGPGQSPRPSALLQNRLTPLEVSLESQKQMNSDLQRQCEELAHVRGEIQENLLRAEQAHQSFVAEASQRISKLQEDTSVHQNAVAETLLALENKERELEVWKAKLEAEQAVVQELRQSNRLLEDALNELRRLCETLSSEKKEMSCLISLSQKEVEELTQENETLRGVRETLSQERVSLLQQNKEFSDRIEEREKSVAELADQYRRERLALLQRCEETGRALEELGDRSARLEQLEVALAEERREAGAKLALAEERNQSLSAELGAVRRALRSEMEELRASCQSEADGLKQEILALKEERNRMQKEVSDLLRENGQLTELAHAQHEGPHPGLGLARGSEGPASEASADTVQLQMDLDVRDPSPSSVPEALPEDVEVRLPAGEAEKVCMQQELQTLRGELAGDLPDNLSQGTSSLKAWGTDAAEELVSERGELPSSQSGSMHLQSSLQLALSRLAALEELCEGLRGEKLGLASELSASRSQCAAAARKMAEEVEELVNAAKLMNTESGLLQGELLEEVPAGAGGGQQHEQVPASLHPWDDSGSHEGVSLSSKEVQTHFTELQEKLSMLRREHQVLHDRHREVISMMSQLRSCVVTLKAGPSSVSVGLRHSHRDSVQEMEAGLGEGTAPSPSFSRGTDGPGVTSSAEASFYGGVVQQTGDTSPLRKVEGDVSADGSAVDEGVCSCVDGDTLTTEAAPPVPGRSVDELESLCRGYLETLRELEDKLEAQALARDREIQDLERLLSSERQELDCLRRQCLSQNEQWERKLSSVTLEMESRLAAEKQQTEQLSLELEVARLQLQGLDLCSRSLLGTDAEGATQSQMENCDIQESEEHASETAETALEPGCHQICEDDVPQDLTLETEKTAETRLAGAGVGSGEQLSEASCGTPVGVGSPGCLEHVSELSFCGPDALGPMDTVENQVSEQNLPLQVEVTSGGNLGSLQAVSGHGDGGAESSLHGIQELDCTVVFQEMALKTKTEACMQLEKMVEELQKEKASLSEKLEPFSRENLELGPSVGTSEVSPGDSTGEGRERTTVVDGSWRERCLGAEEALSRVTLEKARAERLAQAVQADLRAVQMEKRRLEEDREDQQQALARLEEALSVASGERGQLCGELDAAVKEREALAQRSETLRAQIRELEAHRAESLRHVQAMEAEVRDKTALLETLSSEASQLSQDQAHLQGRLRRAEEDSRALEREAESLRAELREAQEARAAALTQKDAVAARLGSAQDEVRQLREGMEELSARIAADETRRRRGLEELRESQREEGALRQQAERLQRELQAAEDSQELLVLEAESAKAEVEALRAQVDAAARDLRGCRLDLAAARSEGEELARQLAERRDQAAALHAEVSSLQSLLEEREQARIQMREECDATVATLQVQLTELSEDVEALCSSRGTPEATGRSADPPREAVPALRRSIGWLRARMDADDQKQLRVLEQLRGSERQAASLRARVQTLEKELALLERGQEQAVLEAERARAEAESLSAEVREMGQTLHTLQGDLVSTKSEKESLTQDLQKAREQASEFQTLSSSLENLLKEKEKEKVQMKEESETAVELLQRQLKELNGKMAALAEDQEARGAECQRLRRQTEVLELEKVRLLQDLGEARDGCTHLQSAVNGLRQELEAGKQQLGKQDEELIRLKGQVQDRAQLRSRLAQVEAEQQLWQMQKAELERRAVALEQEVQELQTQNRALQGALEALRLSHAERESQLTSVQADNAALLGKVAALAVTGRDPGLPREVQETEQRAAGLREELSGESTQPAESAESEEARYSQAGHLKYVNQLKKENERAQGKIKLLLKSCRQLEEEKGTLEKQLSQLEAAQQQEAGAAVDASAGELMAEIKELKESLEAKAREADEYLDKYCSLLIRHEKLERAKEIVETQVARLSAQQSQRRLPGSPSPRAASREPSPVPPAKERKLSSGRSKASSKRQRSSGMWENGAGPAPSTPDAFPRKSRKVARGDVQAAENEVEFEPEGLPEVVKKGFADIPTGKTSPYVLRRTTMPTRTSPRLAAQKLALSPLSLGKENLTESSRSTAGGSRSQKQRKVFLLQRITARKKRRTPLRDLSFVERGTKQL